MHKLKKRKKSIFLKKNVYFLGFCIIIIFILIGLVSKILVPKDIEFESLDIKSVDKVVRAPVVAGQFYPAEKEQLELVVEKAFEMAEKKKFDGDIKALIVPHAGYIYSGLTAAQGFKQLDKEYETVFIIAGNHNSNAQYSGISVPDATHYQTPLGDVKVSSLTKELKETHPDIFTTNDAAHTTHIIEVELPFLQSALSDFEIVPMVTGFMTHEQIIKAAKIIEEYLDDDTLIVVSSDLSHYHSYDEAIKIDLPCIDTIAKLDIEGTQKCEACGMYAIHILMNIAKSQGYLAEVIDYKNSGDVVADKSRVVGYTAIVFHKEEGVGKESKELFLTLARKTLENYLAHGTIPSVTNVDLLPSDVTAVQGCFVTLEKNHQLRGCIGHIIPQEELYNCVIVNAVNAAVNDHRFQPVTADELDDIVIEISVLSVPEELEHETAEDVLNFMEPMKHGVVLKQAFRQSTYLPQVWANFATKEDFLESLCGKGGMAKDCWKDKNTEIFTYTAQVFAEGE